MAKENCTKSVKKLTFPITWVWVIVLVVLAAATGVHGLFSTAKASGDRANVRVDGIEKRLDRIEDKLDRVLLEVKK